MCNYVYMIIYMYTVYSIEHRYYRISQCSIWILLPGAGKTYTLFGNKSQEGLAQYMKLRSRG